jgi:hypothetical protein
MLMAILAFPGGAEEKAFKRAVEALCAQNINVTCATMPADTAKIREIYPDYAGIDDGEIRRRLRTLKRRLNDRMIASRMSLGFLQEAVTDQPAVLPPGMPRLSLNALSMLVLDQSRESVPENVEKRAWRESLPVIHIAAAYQVLMRACEIEGEPFDPDLQNLDAHRRVVRIAEIHEQLVLADKRFGIAPEKLVRLRWVE